MTTALHFGAIDCGTNSTRLLIVDASSKTVVREMRITRLGAGVDATGALDPAAIERTISVLSEFRKIIDRFEPVRFRCVATSAVRDAANGEEFLRRAQETLGVSAEMLPGEEEGRLAYAGATADIAPGSGEDLVVDIGGGSTELILVRDGQLGVISLPLGCVRLSERHLHNDPPTKEEIAAMEKDISDQLDRAQREVPQLNTLAPNSRAIGLAGTVATLAMLEQSLAIYDRNKVHGYVLSDTTIERWYHTLLTESAMERAKRPGMTKGREDVIVGGISVLNAVVKRFSIFSCIASESDILDGVVNSLSES